MFVLFGNNLINKELCLARNRIFDIIIIYLVKYSATFDLLIRILVGTPVFQDHDSESLFSIDNYKYLKKQWNNYYLYVGITKVFIDICVEENLFTIKLYFFLKLT